MYFLNCIVKLLGFLYPTRAAISDMCKFDCNNSVQANYIFFSKKYSVKDDFVTFLKTYLNFAGLI